MMLSSWVMNPTWYSPAACPMKNSVIARPRAILTICCLRWPAVLASSLQEEFHFHSGKLDHVVILERVRRGADLLAIDRGPVGPFHMRDEVALRPAGQHRDPDPRLAERAERLGELDLLAGKGARQQLDGAERLRRLGGRRWRGPGILVCDPGGGGAGGYLLRGGGARSARRLGGGLRGAAAGHCLGLLGRCLHRRGPQHHGLLEIRLLGADRSGGLADELQLVLAQLDDVVVLQEV